VQRTSPEWINPALPLPPAALGAPELDRLMRTVEGRNEPVVSGQHVVSQVVLREFSGKDKNGGTTLVAYNLEFGSKKVLGTRGCGKIKDWMPVASSSIEQLWQETETNLAEALRSLKSGSIFGDEASASVLRDALALHYVRSAHMRSVAQNAAAEAYVGQFLELIPKYEQRLAHEFYVLNGRLPSTPEEYRQIAEHIVRDRQQEMVQSLFRVKAEEAFRRIQSIFSRVTFEIVEAPKSREFLIADAPVCGTSPRGQRHETGPHNGLGIYSAREWTMPLTPKHAIRLPSQSAAYSKANNKQVDKINAAQIRNSHRHVYLRPPGRALVEFVRQGAVDWRRPPAIEPLRLFA
jgi:hypothetical protein